MIGKNRQETCKGQFGWLFHGLFILYQECYFEKLKPLRRGWMNTFIHVFHHKFLHMSPTHGVANSTPNEHKGLWKMSKIGVLFLAALKRTFFFSPLKSYQFFLCPLVHLMNMYNHRSKFFLCRLIHLMNMYDHRCKHVFIVKKIEGYWRN
jgi:hypothetical protein